MYLTIEKQDINLFTTTEESLYGGQLTMMASAVSHPSIVEMCVHTRKENVSVKLNVIGSFSDHYCKYFSMKINYGWVSLEEQHMQ